MLDSAAKDLLARSPRPPISARPSLARVVELVDQARDQNRRELGNRTWIQAHAA